MKGRVKIFLTMFLFYISDVLSQKPAETASPNRDEPQSYACHQRIMTSYLLKGVEFSHNRTFILCPTVKHNCCTRHDQQRIYHFVRDILPPKISEYTQKVDVMLYQIRYMHSELRKTRPVFTGRRDRRRFCARRYRDLINFDFQTLYNEVLEEVEVSAHTFEEHYQKFFCVLCDGKSHLNFIFRENRQSAGFDIDYCHDMLKENKELVMQLNVELVKYFQIVQHVVDCLHYSRSFNLTFPNMRKITEMTEIRSCYDEIDGPRFRVTCLSVCNRIEFSRIMPMFHGDFDFLHDIVTVFNRFIAYRESGNLISMRLRRFFRRFRIPRRMTRTARTNFFQNLVIRQPKPILRQRSKKIITFREETRLPARPATHSRKLVDQPKTKKTLHKMPERRLVSLEGFKHNSANPPRKLPTHHRRVQAFDDIKTQPSTQSRRFLQAMVQTYSILKREQKSNVKFTQFSPADVYFDKVLQEFYNDIEIPRKDEPRPTVYPVRLRPIVFDNMIKSWNDHTGINLHFYTNLHFDMSQTAFYRVLYTYRKPDVPDSKLTIFLMDFTQGFFHKCEEILEMDSKIMANNYMSKQMSDMQIEDEDRRRKLRLITVRRKKEKRGIRTKKLKKE